MPGVKRTISAPVILTPEVQQIRALAFKNPDKFINSQLKVTDKLANVYPFRYNWTQKKIAAIIREQYRLGIPLRLWILKSRQIGSSTGIAARFFTQIWAHDNLEGLILSQYDERSEELLERVKFFYASLHPALKLSLARDSKSAIQFADTRSKLSMVSTRTKDTAKGGTKQRVMISEFTVLPDPLGTLKEFQQPMAFELGTELIIETTGANWGGPAHDHWRRTKRRRTNFLPLFLPWQEDPTAVMKFESERERDLKLAEIFEIEPRFEERMKLHKLTPEQVAWTFSEFHNKCDDDYELYLQYYPCTEDEAWRTKSESFFGTEHVNKLRRLTLDFPCEYRIFGVNAPYGEEFDGIDKLQRIEEPADENLSQPLFKFWKRPHPKGDYIVSGDSAEGEEDGNFTSDFVIDMNTLEMVAEFHGRVRPDEHARIMASLGYIYNHAILAPEVNAPGNVTLFELQRMSYPNMYRWKVLDNYKPTATIKVAWQTNHSTRPTMLALAKRLVEDIAKDRIRMSGIVKSRSLVDEMATFGYNPSTGRPEGLNGANDDRVMAWAIAVAVASWETYGTEKDILSLYKTQEGEMQAHGIEAPTVDPQEVIQGLLNQHHGGLLRDENGNSYGGWNLRYR